jgi:TetR/AcrR family transcriptional regulator, transcriptional repressor for nem operon
MDTRETLVEHATRLVRRTGYAGFSYADLSDAVGLRKASIHHHFPAKADLGLEIVECYRRTFSAELDAIKAGATSAIDRIEAYAKLYRQGVSAGTTCLCGVLAAEFDALPPGVQKAVTAFFDDNVTWLEAVLKDGRRNGDVVEAMSPRKTARMILATLQGAMLMARAQGDKRSFDDAVQEMLAATKR